MAGVASAARSRGCQAHAPVLMALDLDSGHGVPPPASPECVVIVRVEVINVLGRVSIQRLQLLASGSAHGLQHHLPPMHGEACCSAAESWTNACRGY